MQVTLNDILEGVNEVVRVAEIEDLRYRVRQSCLDACRLIGYQLTGVQSVITCRVDNGRVVLPPGCLKVTDVGRGPALDADRLLATGQFRVGALRFNTSGDGTVRLSYASSSDVKVAFYALATDEEGEILLDDCCREACVNHALTRLIRSRSTELPPEWRVAGAHLEFSQLATQEIGRVRAVYQRQTPQRLTNLVGFLQGRR